MRENGAVFVQDLLTADDRTFTGNTFVLIGNKLILSSHSDSRA
jgi:hypothetical protein